ncbi:MAG: helix-turn-helix domain-containing protein [Verrucomicrobiae bacterium]
MNASRTSSLPKKDFVPDQSPMFDFSVLRGLRKRDGLSIEQVSKSSGVSAAVISKLERNQTSAELSTLFRLGRVFGINTTELISLAESRTAQLARSTTRQSGAFHFKEIAYGNARLLFGSAPGGATVSRPEIHRDDYEICWVLSGKVEINLPHERHVIEAGGGIQFDAILDHTYAALEACQVIIAHLRKGKRF